MSIEIRDDDRRLQQLLNRLQGQVDNLEPAMREIAGHLVSSVEDSFASQSEPDGSAWEPLAHATIQDRLRRGYGAGPILERSGDLATRILADWDDEMAVAGHQPDLRRHASLRGSQAEHSGAAVSGCVRRRAAGHYSHAAGSPGGADRCRVTVRRSARTSALATSPPAARTARRAHFQSPAHARH